MENDIYETYIRPVLDWKAKQCSISPPPDDGDGCVVQGRVIKVCRDCLYSPYIGYLFKFYNNLRNKWENNGKIKRI